MSRKAEKECERFVLSDEEGKARLRAFHWTAAIIELVAVLVGFLLIYLLPVATDKYAACIYTLFSTPGIFLPIVLDLGCLDVALMALLLLLCHGLFRLGMTAFFYKEYEQGIAEGKYNNPFRWIRRGAILSFFYVLALHVSGVRDFVTMIVFLIIYFFVEMLRAFAEIRTTYAADRKRVTVTQRRSGRNAFYASIYGAGLVISSQLIYWVLYIFQNVGAVSFMTWFYGIGHLVLYTIFSVWIWIYTSRTKLKYMEPYNTEVAWIVYGTVEVLILTGLAILGTVFA